MQASKAEQKDDSKLVCQAGWDKAKGRVRLMLEGLRGQEMIACAAAWLPSVREQRHANQVTSVPLIQHHTRAYISNLREIVRMWFNSLV